MQLTATKMSTLKIAGEKKRHSPDELLNYVRQVEALFKLPPGSLSKRNEETGRPVKNIEGVSVSDIRKAAIFHFHNHSSVPYIFIGQYFGIGNASAINRIIERSKEHLETKDEQFQWCYEIITTIVV